MRKQTIAQGVLAGTMAFTALTGCARQPATSAPLPNLSGWQARLNADCGAPQSYTVSQDGPGGSWSDESDSKLLKADAVFWLNEMPGAVKPTSFDSLFFARHPASPFKLIVMRESLLKGRKLQVRPYGIAGTRDENIHVDLYELRADLQIIPPAYSQKDVPFQSIIVPHAGGRPLYQGVSQADLVAENAVLMVVNDAGQIQAAVDLGQVDYQPQIDSRINQRYSGMAKEEVSYAGMHVFDNIKQNVKALLVTCGQMMTP